MKESPLEHFDGIKENRENPPPVYFSVLFYGFIIFGIVYAAFYLLSGWSSQGEFKEEMKEHQSHYQMAQ